MTRTALACAALMACLLHPAWSLPRFVAEADPTTFNGRPLATAGACVLWEAAGGSGPAAPVSLGRTGRKAADFTPDDLAQVNARLAALRPAPQKARIRVTRDGYEDLSMEIPFATLTSNPDTIRLRLVPRYADVTFISEPTDAEVHLGAPDGLVIARSGQPTRLALPLFTDTHGQYADARLYFTRSGYETSDAQRFEPRKLQNGQRWPAEGAIRLVARAGTGPTWKWIGVVALLAAAGAWMMRRRASTRLPDPTPTLVDRPRTVPQRRTLGAWIVGERLGAGGSATVYKTVHAEKDPPGGPWAVKILDESAALERSERRRFAREMTITSALSHPGIVKVVDWDADGPTPYLVMERVDGPSLRRVLAAGPLPVDVFRRMFGDLLDAVAHAHAQGVVHRDLKPENILIGRGDMVRVVDFGIARGHMFDRVTTTGTTLGTLAYLPPERFVAAIEDDPTADQFALGVIAYEMLTGRQPMPQHALTDAMLGITPYTAKDLCTLIPALPRAVETVLTRLRAMQMEERFASVAEARQAFDAGWGETGG